MVWFGTGMAHILSMGAYDHILFVTLLVTTFAFRDWQKLLLVITAFTVGHSISLAISTLGFIRISAPLIEALIATTVLVSSIYAILSCKKPDTMKLWTFAAAVAFFGLIHGLGFSFLLKAMLGKEQSVFLPLLYFNLGLELGQLIIVLVVLVFSLLLVKLIKLSLTSYKLIIACSIAFIAAKITLERFLELY